MEHLKTIWEQVKIIVECVVFALMSLITIVVALIPSIIYQYNGGTNTDIDLALRILGFVIWLLFVVWVMNRKSPYEQDEKSDNEY
ncbi:hypothetical protein FOI42_RS02430 [Escherichia coli]|nr:hypothetical protein [Escherichia coli]MED6699161.1 hypothetical protein [Escherichia coli O157]HCQ0858820.1 hypothetical protein [Escherichia coli]